MIREKPILRRPFHEGFALLFAGLLFLSCGSANALPISKSASFATGNTNIVQVATSICALINTQIEDLKSQGRKNALLMLASKSGELRFVTVRMD